jgi:hypothetical protein
MNTALRAAVGLLIVAVVALAVALFLVASNLSGDVDLAKRDAARAEAQARKVAATKPATPEVTQAELDTVEDTLTTQVEGVQARVGKRIKRIEDCVPEVQAQIDSLDIEVGPYITTNQQVSRVCQSLVYGTPVGG